MGGGGVKGILTYLHNKHRLTICQAAKLVKISHVLETLYYMICTIVHFSSKSSTHLFYILPLNIGLDHVQSKPLPEKYI